MDTLKTVLVSVAILTGAASPSWAGQAPAAAAEGPVSLSVLGGASAGSGNAGAAAGLTIGADFNDRVSLEGRGVYLDRGPGQSALDVNASVLVNLLTGRKAVPYVAVGGGLYRAMFDLGNQGLFGMMASGVPAGSQLVALQGGQGWGAMPGAGMMGGWPAGQSFGPGWMMGGFAWNNSAVTGPTFAGSQMPMFYARRVGALTAPSDGRWHMQSFTDPALSFGGGVNIALTNSLYVRPDLRALTIIGGGDAYTIGSATFGLGYRF
jgi:hypothetical protein